ncbi:endonuclease III, partial [bacterium]|nr:endonuclease III [bacterium]
QRQIRELFQQQKGIGVKTISVTLMFACGHDVFPVDTHVHRLCGRLGLVPAEASAEKTFTLMAPRIPNGKGYSFHVNMIRLGREICQARKPACPQCPLKKKCPSAQRPPSK